MSCHPTTRLKLVVNTVARHMDAGGGSAFEEITLSAVYSDKEGAANKEWSKWTPTGQLKFTVTNPVVHGRFLPGQFYYADLILTDKDSL